MKFLVLLLTVGIMITNIDTQTVCMKKDYENDSVTCELAITDR